MSSLGNKRKTRNAVLRTRSSSKRAGSYEEKRKNKRTPREMAMRTPREDVAIAVGNESRIKRSLGIYQHK